ncbi:F0F1 ATP synthase subunit gamma [Francisella philomiragia]|uniref:ATP synthase gamma chain n=1 Tax=Francisella philomiragia subsp. philomiragia (strain ATCC 25017 / CCUG 19701 / FSC 153 / O\|nr:F0F1 ATP synthase subunit gamma [Francisella philomiragia]B0TWS6.1 RecName: Full=ATP synthase gamma chain; AltName: Full=ATP synthase F1 sector gamma subunit; AltName: Full=F-ATPase gamma subunit [Francisella philomiragia subsp. philomiragia ATCC 25017]AJI46767.1 ATP synthase F1, gamma subunit [Francisella philomiragia]AJI48879.1 ATP synthase F1, gamma subunit [Francisella philomiragia]MBK2021553.1 F0F1 ATP synthase subunit gamma [Francisella philomiragia]MBK2030593.1 F0F1 ATP synthase subu
MSNAREIRSKVQSVKNTQKITGAMELVAASKMRGAIVKMNNVRPYVESANTIIKNVTMASIDYPNPYLFDREVKRVGYIVTSTDRGLCGGLNINLFKHVLKDIKKNLDDRVEVDVCAIGSKAATFFAKLIDVNVVATAHYNDKDNEGSIRAIRGALKVMLDRFTNGEIDRLYMSSNQFVSTIKQKPKLQTLLPIQDIFSKEELKTNKEQASKGHWDYIYERDIEEVLNALCIRYIEAQVRGAILENAACEQAARMMAMKNATDNASDIIDQLKLDYNKVRQAMITQELAEICSGAAAV